AYFAELESPDRARWQQPERVVETLRLRPGMTVADLGAGTGYFARRFAAAVGPTGKVLALDTEPEMLEELRRRAPDATTIETRRVEPDDPRLAPASVDLIFICNTGHHLHERVRYYGKLRRALRRGGRLVLVDFYKRALRGGRPAFPRRGDAAPGPGGGAGRRPRALPRTGGRTHGCRRRDAPRAARRPAPRARRGAGPRGRRLPRAPLPARPADGRPPGLRALARQHRLARA